MALIKLEGRLQWIAVAPVIDGADTIAEAERAKSNGACSGFMRLKALCGI